MKALTKQRYFATSVLCALGLTLAAASGAYAAESASGLARLDGSIGHAGKFDPFTDGARGVHDPRSPFTDGAHSVNAPRDVFTDGARSVQEARSAFSDGA